MPPQPRTRSGTGTTVEDTILSKHALFVGWAKRSVPTVPAGTARRARLCPPYSPRSQAEHEQHRRGRRVFQLRRKRNDVLGLARSYQDRDVLLPVHRIADRRRIDAGADVETPHLLEGFGVVGREGAVDVAYEHQVAGCSERAGIVRIGELEGCLEFAGGRIDRFQAAVEPLADHGSAAAETLAWLDGAALVGEVLLLDGFDVVTALDGRDVEQAQLRIIGGRLPVLATRVSRAKLLTLRLGATAVRALGIGLAVGVGIIVDRLACLGVEAGRPVHLVGVLLAGDEGAVGAIKRVEVAVAGGVHHELAVLAVDLGVDDRVFGDFVEIIGIIRRVLEAPFDLAVIRAQRQHARGPLVVAGAIFRVPVWPGIADALVERVGLRVIGRGLPHGPAAMLPALLAVLPGLVAGLAGTRDRVRPPRRLAGVEVGCLDVTADAELATGGAHDRQVANDEWRDRQRLADRRVGNLALPRDFTGLLVDGEHPPVERNGNHLVLPQRNAAIIDAAASYVAGPGAVGAGVHLPFDDAFLAGRHVDCVDRAPAVRHIHDAVLDDRRRFQVTEGVASAALEARERHREHRLQVFDGLGVDLLEQREAMTLVVAVMEDPVLRLALRVQGALIRHVGGAHRRERRGHQQRADKRTGERLRRHGFPPIIDRLRLPPVSS